MRLLILRHAKAAPDRGEGDHGRALEPAGVAAAAWAGARMAERGWSPTLALVSDALRTRETFERAAAQLPTAPALLLRPDLYEASPDDILHAIAAAPPETPCLLVVGHNPGLAETARRLAQAGSPPLRNRLAQGFPPAALAVIALGAGPAAAAAGGTLEDLLLPP